MIRDQAFDIWQAGLDAVRAGPLVQNSLQVDGDFLMVDTESFDRRNFDRTIVVGGGKAASAMAASLQSTLEGWLPINGIVNVPEGTQRTVPGIKTHPARPAGINEPTFAGVEGASEMIRLVREAGQRDLVIVLLSGGGSALMPLPIEGVTIEDQLAVIRLLSGTGATIDELNTVRKHLSQIKGGGLLRACRAGAMMTLVLSDVLGDPLDVIASGPTVPDTSTANDAVEVLRHYDPSRNLPSSVYAALEREPGQTPPSPIGSQTRFSTIVIGNNAVAVDAAGVLAESMGLNHIMQSARQSEGAAEEIGHRIADIMVEMLRMPPDQQQHNCLIWGGEPTVQLAASDLRGKGGRNQQLVLAAYQRLKQHQLSDLEWQRIVILSAGTDGEDGPTDAAGAVIDTRVHKAAVALNLDVESYLRRNDAYHFFDQTDGLIMTGPTGTNVCDLRVAISECRPERKSSDVRSDSTS